jgi:hypothetical protein
MREFSLLVGIREDKRPFWIPRRKWKDNIKMDLRELECDCMVNWMNMAQDRVYLRVFLNTVLKLRTPEKEENFLTS